MEDILSQKAGISKKKEVDIMQYLITHWEYGDRKVIKVVSNSAVNDYRETGYEIYEIKDDGELKKIKFAEESITGFWCDLARQRGMDIPELNHNDFRYEINVSDYLEELKAIIYNACFELREQSLSKRVELSDINNYVYGILDNIETLLQGVR